MTKPCHPACIDTPEPDEVRHRLDWLHPDRGRVAEVACAHHLSLVHGAAAILGMGSIAALAEPGTPCTRCSNPHRTAPDFLASRDVQTAHALEDYRTMTPVTTYLQPPAGHRYMDLEEL